MKKAIPCLLVLSLFLSCTKDNNTPPTIDLTGLPVSYTLNSTVQQLGIRNVFAYDQNHSLASVSLYTADTLGGNITLDSGSFYFTVDQSVTLPTGYLYDFFRTGLGATQVENHLLYFSNGKQLLKDSAMAISGNGPSSSAKYYYYSGNITVVNTYSQTADYGWSLSAVDSITTNNGNVTHTSHYSYAGPNLTGIGFTTLSYTSDVNPLYNAGLAYSLGPLLLLGGGGDFISKNLPAENIVWTKNASGKIISGVSAGGSYIWYGY